MPGLKTGVKSDMFLSETGLGFGVPGGIPPLRIPRSTPASIELKVSCYTEPEDD